MSDTTAITITEKQLLDRNFHSEATMSNAMIKRTLFIHCKPATDDGVIRMNGRSYSFVLCQGKLHGKKMNVWVRELSPDLFTLTDRVLVYCEPRPTNESFIGHADYREAV